MTVEENPSSRAVSLSSVPTRDLNQVFRSPTTEMVAIGAAKSRAANRVTRSKHSSAGV